MTQGGFTITDTANNTPVPQTLTRLQRAPPSRVRGSGDEEYFLTLHPLIPTTVSTKFSRGADKPPQPRAIVERGWELDEQGNERKIRRSTKGCGVDGLEGSRPCYKVDVSRGSLMGVWWRWGTKEEMLVDSGATEWTLSSLPAEQTPLEIEQIAGAQFSIGD